MHIALDLTALLPRPTGVDVALIELTCALGETDRVNHYTILVNYEEQAGFLSALPDNFKVVRVSLRNRFIRLLAQQLLFPVLTWRLRIDVLHSPSFFMPLVRGRARHVLTVHDMTSFSSPERHNRFRGSTIFRWAMAICIRRAHIVTTPSQHAKQSLLQRIDVVDAEKVQVVPWGLPSRFTECFHENVKTVLDALEIPEKYILAVGTIQPRKNPVGLLRAYRRLLDCKGVPEYLVFAGAPGWFKGEFDNAVEELELNNRVIELGYVADEHLPCLYAGARLFVYPSLEEGFGFPPLEAMACGTPTIASDCSALRENLEGAAMLVQPQDTKALAQAMDTMLNEEATRERYQKLGAARANEFRWSRTAAQMHEIYTRVAIAG